MQTQRFVPLRNRFVAGDFSGNTGLLALTGLLFLLLSLFVPRFFTLYNISNIVEQTSATGMMAIGLTFVLITGGIDLSLPAVMAAAAVVGSTYMVQGGDPAIGCVLMLLTAVACGICNGLAVARLRMIPLVVTLSMMVIASGLAVWITDAQSVFGLPESYLFFFTRDWLYFPTPFISLLLAAGAAYLLLHKSMFGRWVFAIGLNAKTARISGIPIRRVTLLVYTIAGAFAGFAAIHLTARLGSASASMGPETLVLDVISAAVIGGVSIYGGKGTIHGVLFGALFITIIGNSMNLLGVTYFTTLIIKGAIIVIATGVDALRAKAR